MALAHEPEWCEMNALFPFAWYEVDVLAVCLHVGILKMDGVLKVGQVGSDEGQEGPVRVPASQGFRQLLRYSVEKITLEQAVLRCLQQ